MLIKKKKNQKSTKPSAVHMTAPQTPTAAAQIPPQTIENKARQLVQGKIQEMMNAAEAEIAQRRASLDDEVKQITMQAQLEAKKSVEATLAEVQAIKQEMIAKDQELNQAKINFENIKKQELTKAYNEGITNAKQDIDGFMQMLGSFHNAKQDLALELKDEIVSIALDIAKQVIAHEVKNDPDLLEEQVLKAISKVITTKGLLQVFLNPKDFPKVDYLETAMTRVLDASVKLVFLEDEAVDRGSCVVNTQGGKLDARFSTQIEVIKSAFELHLGHKILELPETEETVIEEASEQAELNVQAEPSDADLDELEMDDEILTDLENDGDLDGLLDDLLNDDTTNSTESKEATTASKAIDAESLAKAISLVDANDGLDLGANDFANGDDLDIESAEKGEDEELTDDDVEFEEFDEFAGEEDTEEDSNFDSTEAADPRYPEY